MTNIQQQYHNRVVVLQNLLDRIVPTRGNATHYKNRIYSLKGVITLEERNAIAVALNELKTKSHSLRLGGGEEGGE